MDKKPPLFEFAFCPEFQSKLIYLSEIAEKENWRYDNPKASDSQKELAVLYSYIHQIFSKWQCDNKIVRHNGYAVINTGVLTTNGEDIYMLFVENKNVNADVCPYLFLTFKKRSSRDLPPSLVTLLPEPIDFFENQPQESYFDTRLEMILNIDHIYDDNYHRLPKGLQELDRDTAIMLLNGAREKIMKKIKRNNRIAVPQFYNGHLQFLIPLEIMGQIVPIAVEKFENQYRANTVLTLDMAYCNARLIMKPESNWLMKK